MFRKSISSTGRQKGLYRLMNDARFALLESMENALTENEKRVNREVVLETKNKHKRGQLKL